MRFCDLHMHTWCSSDSFNDPADVVGRLLRAGCVGFSSTDHNSLRAVPMYRRLAAQAGLAYIPGVEINTNHPVLGNVHVISYGLGPEYAPLESFLKEVQAANALEFATVVDYLHDRGIIPDIEAFLEFARNRWPERELGHKQVSLWLVYHGFAKDLARAKEVFLDLAHRLGSPKPPKPHPAELAALVHGGGGCVVWAHPAKTPGYAAELKRMVAWGIDGLEVFTPSNPGRANRRLLYRYARERGLMVTGGSDAHVAPPLYDWFRYAPAYCFDELSAQLDRTGLQQPRAEAPERAATR